MTIPALREIRRLFPNAHITLMIRPWVRDVFHNAAYIDDILLYDKNATKGRMNRMLNIVEKVKGRTFDMAILLQNAVEAALIAMFAGIPIRLGYPTDGRGLFLTHRAALHDDLHSKHQIYYYLGILTGSGLSNNTYHSDVNFHPDITISLEPRALDRAKEILREHQVDPQKVLIGLNPGAHYGPAKRWLSDRYAQLADELMAKNDAEILIFGSAKEEKLATEIISQMRFKPKVLAGQTSLLELMALLKSCQLLITNDSGPMHLAAALDVPQIALFGSTNEVATGPFSEKARLIKHPVFCSPCLLRECPIDFRCFISITVPEVYTAVVEKLNKI